MNTTLKTLLHPGLPRVLSACPVPHPRHMPMRPLPRSRRPVCPPPSAPGASLSTARPGLVVPAQERAAVHHTPEPRAGRQRRGGPLGASHKRAVCRTPSPLPLPLPPALCPELSCKAPSSSLLLPRSPTPVAARPPPPPTRMHTCARTHARTRVTPPPCMPCPSCRRPGEPREPAWQQRERHAVPQRLGLAQPLGGPGLQPLVHRALLPAKHHAQRAGGRAGGIGGGGGRGAVCVPRRGGPWGTGAPAQMRRPPAAALLCSNAYAPPCAVAQATRAAHPPRPCFPPPTHTTTATCPSLCRPPPAGVQHAQDVYGVHRRRRGRGAARVCGPLWRQGLDQQDLGPGQQGITHHPGCCWRPSHPPGSGCACMPSCAVLSPLHAMPLLPSAPRTLLCTPALVPHTGASPPLPSPQPPPTPQPHPH